MKRKIIYFFTSILALCTLSACGNDTPSNQTYDGRVFDISEKQDGSLTAQSIKDGNYYSLNITGEGLAINYSKKEEVPWNPIIKKINKVTINEGIENIGDYYFYSLPLEYFILPATVKAAGDNSFNSVSNVFTYGDLLPNIENAYYYSESKPGGEGNYFYMDNGEPHIWIISPVSFLFIGNSFTYRGTNTSDTENPEVPADFKKIANNLNITVNIDSVCKGSHTLAKFSNQEDEMGSIVETKLTTKQYDYVILQEQSTTPINNYNNFVNAIKAIKKRVNETQNKCQVVLYETWGTPYNVGNDPQTYGATVTAMEAKVRDAYTRAGDEAECLVNYIGKAFTYAYEHEHINIYADDNRHQNGLGAYLSAASHVRSLFKVRVSNCSEYCGLSENECKALLSITDTVI